MTESFMTIEGDRSGVNTPDHREKSRNALESALTRLSAETGDISDSERALIQQSFAVASFHLNHIPRKKAP